MTWPKRRWVVESRPRMFPHMPWKLSLGPYFRESTARDMMGRAGWFDGGLVAWRIRDRHVAVARPEGASAGSCSDGEQT